MGHLRSLFGSVPRCLELLRSQRWPRARIEAQRRASLNEVLRSARAIPFYAERFPAGKGDLQSLPVLERRDVTALTTSVRALHAATTPFLAGRSSGSTGMPREFLFDESHQRGRFAARMRYLLANGWNPLRRTAWVIFLPEGTPDGRLIRSPMLLNAHFHSALDPVDAQLDWLRYIDPELLYTLPSNLGMLLDRIEATGVELPALRRVLTGGEVVDPALRERTRALLGVEIGDNYGSTEAFLAWQCREDRYHVNAEHVLVEIVDENGAAVPPGGLGRVLITTLENRLCPLIRYAIGDFAEPGEGACPCGRTLPLLGRVAGRSINLFHLADGRTVTPWGLVVALRGHRDLDQFQLVQKTPDRFVVRHVSAERVAEATQRELEAEFREILGLPVQVAFEPVDEIARSPTGKFMTALSEVRS